MKKKKCDKCGLADLIMFRVKIDTSKSKLQVVEDIGELSITDAVQSSNKNTIVIEQHVTL